MFGDHRQFASSIAVLFCLAVLSPVEKWQESKYWCQIFAVAKYWQLQHYLALLKKRFKDAQRSDHKIQDGKLFVAKSLLQGWMLQDLEMPMIPVCVRACGCVCVCLLLLCLGSDDWRRSRSVCVCVCDEGGSVWRRPRQYSAWALSL